jgi:hypothetical protein
MVGFFVGMSVTVGVGICVGAIFLLLEPVGRNIKSPIPTIITMKHAIPPRINLFIVKNDEEGTSGTGSGCSCILGCMSGETEFVGSSIYQVFQ